MKSYFKYAGKIALYTIAVTSLTACAFFHPELDRPVEMGNTIDQFNSIEKYSPVYVNVNISYEFEFVDHEDFEEKGEEIWIYKGRMDDMKNRYMQLSYTEIDADQTPPPGAVITQGRKRVTGYDTCITKNRDLSADEKVLFGDAINNLDTYALSDDMPKTDLFVRRFIENNTPEDARRLEAVYFISLDELGYKCADFDTNNEVMLEMLADWRAESLRSFEIIG
ncbi:hypothetical protein [Curvivirga aplysinae]|uniref:hypothetical protein n=1 Tax=Curvivirga aplysinae TaxID=2529852 RepID=UPI0012BCFC9F|nr:hypothetical protein [Curvivirga aplysinae]MTI09285.1 hypothetical protein [Curvivirga aplysinae]